MNYRNLSDAIKTYTERVEEPSVLESMRTAIKEAECIVFLGFASHKQTMALLKPIGRLASREIYGTAYKMSDSDVSQVTSELKSFFPEQVVRTHADIIWREEYEPKIENSLTCTELFDYYAKSLAG